MRDTGWRARALADHLSDMLKAEVGTEYESGVGEQTTLAEVEGARTINRRKSTFFARVEEDGRQYRVSVAVHEWREREVE